MLQAVDMRRATQDNAGTITNVLIKRQRPTSAAKARASYATLDDSSAPRVEYRFQRGSTKIRDSRMKADRTLPLRSWMSLHLTRLLFQIHGGNGLDIPAQTADVQNPHRSE